MLLSASLLNLLVYCQADGFTSSQSHWPQEMSENPGAFRATSNEQPLIHLDVLAGSRYRHVGLPRVWLTSYV